VEFTRGNPRNGLSRRAQIHKRQAVAHVARELAVGIRVAQAELTMFVFARLVCWGECALCVREAHPQHFRPPVRMTQTCDSPSAMAEADCPVPKSTKGSASPIVLG